MTCLTKIVILIEKYFDEFTISINVTRAPSGAGISYDTSFDEYIRNANRFTSANIDIDDADERAVQEFLDELKRLEIYFSFGIDILSSNEGYTAQYFYGDEEVYKRDR